MLGAQGLTASGFRLSASDGLGTQTQDDFGGAIFGALRRSGVGDWSAQKRLDAGQPLQHPLASRAVRQDFSQPAITFCRGEIVVAPVPGPLPPPRSGSPWQSAAPLPWACQQIGERRDAVNHHERCIHHRRLNGGSAAGHDGGAECQSVGRASGTSVTLFSPIRLSRKLRSSVGATGSRYS